MSAIFLSASVPFISRGTYHETANPFLIQCAVREMVMAVLHRHTLVWGGHPAITPMLWSICADMDIDYSDAVVLYQSKFFADSFPEENRHFKNVIYTDAVAGNKVASLLHMRKQMLARQDLVGAVFIGGMEGVETEHQIFKHFHPRASVLPVPAPGGAALNLALDHGYEASVDLGDIDFAKLFHTFFSEMDNKLS
jgi:hypothetical protein